MPAEGQSLIVAGAIISIALNPLVFRAIEPVQNWIRSRSKLAQVLERTTDPLAALPTSIDLKRLTGQVVLVGYGRVGSRIGTALTAQGIPFVVAEENREIVEKLREKDIPAVSGDASEPAVLIQAHIHRARMEHNSRGKRGQTQWPSICGKLLAISRPVAAKIKQQNWLFFSSVRETNLRICQASELIYL